MCSSGPGAMKTAATVLQELMMKRGRMPEYECIAQSGPKHQALFEYLCVADGVSVRATARSKKDAKQAAAKRALAALAARGDIVPPPYNAPLEDFDQESKWKEDIEEEISHSESDDPPEKKIKKEEGEGCAGGPASHVALLKELCEQYRLGAPDYCLVGDTGPPHQRRFTMSASVGQHKFLATANNKRAARQAAADLLYRYLRENLARLTDDFNEDEALVRAHEKAMERYVEVAGAGAAWRPNLGQALADYHLGLRAQLDEERCAVALAALAAGVAGEAAGEAGVAAALAALQLAPEHAALGPLRLLRVPRAAPPLAFAGATPAAAAAAAARYLRLALGAAPPPAACK